VGNPLLRATLLASLPDTDAGAHYLDPINEEDVKVMRDRIHWSMIMSGAFKA